MSRRNCAYVVIGLLLAASLTPAQAKPPWSPEEEAKAGRRAAAELERTFKPYRDQKALERVQGIVARLSEHQNPPQTFRVKPVQHPPIEFTVKLLDTEIVNAMSLPGGYIYVTRGLLETVQSDDELAAVLAHEMAHALLYHALEQQEKNKKMLAGSLAATAAAVLLGAGLGGAAAVLQGGQYVRMGVLSGYSVEDETQADDLGLLIAQASSYNPVGQLTLMERLSQESQLEPKPELGIFQTHPYTDERLTNIRRRLERLDVDLNRLSVTRWEQAEAVDCFDRGAVRAQLWLWGRPLLTTGATSADGQGPRARLEVAAEQLNQALEEGLRAYEVQAREQAGAPVVMARDRVLLTVLPEDAPTERQSPREVAEGMVKAIHQAFAWRDLQMTYGG